MATFPAWTILNGQKYEFHTEEEYLHFEQYVNRETPPMPQQPQYPQPSAPGFTVGHLMAVAGSTSSPPVPVPVNDPIAERNRQVLREKEAARKSSSQIQPVDPKEEKSRQAAKEKEEKQRRDEEKRKKEEKDKKAEEDRRAKENAAGEGIPMVADPSDDKFTTLQKKIQERISKDVKVTITTRTAGRPSTKTTPVSSELDPMERKELSAELGPVPSKPGDGIRTSIKVDPKRPQPKIRFDEAHDIKWVFLEIVSLLPDDSNIKMAMWENFTTSCTLFSKLDDLERGGKGGKEIASVVLPFVISEFHDLPLPGGDRARLALCELLCQYPGFIARCFFDGSEERRGGNVNQALGQIATMDRKGLVVDQLLDLCLPLMSPNFHRSELIRTILWKYLKSEDEYSRTAVLSVLSVWISKLPEIELPDDPTAFGVDLMVFLVDVVEVCDRQAKTPLDEPHRTDLLPVFESLRKVIPLIFPPKDGGKHTWDFLEGKRGQLVTTLLGVRGCQNFAKLFSRSDYLQMRVVAIGNKDHEPKYNTMVRLLYEIWEVR